MTCSRRLDWLDILRGLTILWITALHFYVDTRGVPGADASAAAAWQACLRGDVLDMVAVAGRALVGLPGFRLDILLFVTGAVLCSGAYDGPRAFFLRRARSVLPNYWLGTLAFTVALVACAGLRSALLPASLGEEVRSGTLIGRAWYRFEWLDVLRSLSVVGRLQDPRSMQVVAPSLWYLLLVAQVYLVFPWLRAWQRRLGAWTFLAVCALITWGSRALEFAFPLVPGFDVNTTVVSFLPFRLLSPAIGMAAAGWLVRHRIDIPRRVLPLVVWPAAGLLLAAIWIGTRMNEAGSVAGILGATVPLLVALPGLWVVVAGAAEIPPAAAILQWVGRRSLSLLVVQDLLRVAVGTAHRVLGPLGPWTWVVLPAYLLAALWLTRLWHPFQDRVATRWWPLAAVPAARPDLVPVSPPAWYPASGLESGSPRQDTHATMLHQPASSGS